MNSRPWLLLLALATAVVLVGCGQDAAPVANSPTVVPADTSTQTPMTLAPPTAPARATLPPTPIPPTDTPMPTPTLAPTPPPTDTPEPSFTPVPPSPTAISTSSTPGITPVLATGIGKDSYLDDRSSPASLLRSYFNAINRQEYARAYGYWTDADPARPTFTDFEKQFAGVAAVDVRFGALSSQGTAGTFFYSAALRVDETLADQSTRLSVECYQVRFPDPNVRTAPPFQPMSIDKVAATSVGSADEAAARLAAGCENAGLVVPIGRALATPVDPTDISRNRYVDDRSDSVAVLRSLFNAVNQRQYPRAYSYWEAGSQVPPFDQFQQGYANTVAVRLMVGTVKSNSGAGQLYYQVPVTLAATTTTGATQSFVGCYTLHLAQPANQTVPPFHPMAISRAAVNQAPNDADFAALMSATCTA